MTSIFNRRHGRMLAIAYAILVTSITFSWTLELFAQLDGRTVVAILFA